MAKVGRAPMNDWATLGICCKIWFEAKVILSMNQDSFFVFTFLLVIEFILERTSEHFLLQIKHVLSREYEFYKVYVRLITPPTIK